MTTSTDIDSLLLELDFANLTAVQTRVAELVDQRPAEAMARLEKEAELIGAKVRPGNGHKPKRRRASKTHDA